jgi:carbon storage regulator CsrA
MMLVLARKLEQTIKAVLGDGKELTFKVLEIKGTVIRVGIEAPDDVVVVRGEIDTTDLTLRRLVKARR